MSEKHIRKRGRPRTEEYHDLEEYFNETVELERDVRFRKKVAEALLSRGWQKLEETDLGRHTKEGYRPNIKTEFRGSYFRCTVCSKESVGKVEFTIDENHEPPRIRFTLECGHRQETPIEKPRPNKCPKCNGEVQEDAEGLFCILCSWKETDSKKGPLGELSAEENRLLRQLK